MALKSIEEVYQLIDKPDYIIKGDPDENVTSIFRGFAEQLGPDNNQDIIRHCQIEIDVQNFQITDNVLSPLFTGTTKAGEYHEYPSLKNFTEDDYEYIIQRLRITKNIALIIKYSHLLWLSPKKHLSFAKAALKGYREKIDELNLHSWEGKDFREVHNLKIALSNELYLAISTRQQIEIEKSKRKVLAITRKFRINSEKTSTNIRLIQLMLANPKVFKKEDFRNLDSQCFKYAMKQSDLHHKIDVLRVGERVATKLGNHSKKWQEQIGDAYEMLSIQREDNTNLASISFCQEALKAFKKVKDTNKIKQLELRYKELKQKMQLGLFSQDIDLSESLSMAKSVSESLLKKSTEEIIQFLMYSPQIFPPYDFLHSEATKQKEENTFHFLFGTSVNDAFGHTSAHYFEEDEKMHFSMMQTYDFYIQTSTNILIREVVLSSVKANLLNAPLILKYLRNWCWIGQDVIITHQGNEQNRFNWLELLAPGLVDFFSQLYFYFQNPINIPNFVIATDSLVLKIEGILRDMCELRGVTTFFQTKDSKGRLIMREKDINTLLYEDIIKQVLSKDDWILCHFLLIDKVGFNLRNKIAHTLIRKSGEYVLDYMMLLIVLILRLSKHEYSPKPPNVKSD
jgi:hypothetical protein